MVNLKMSHWHLDTYLVEYEDWGMREFANYNIGADGNITEKKITKSLGASFDGAILKAAKELKSIKILGNIYQGKRKIFVPVRFTK